MAAGSVRAGRDDWVGRAGGGGISGTDGRDGAELRVPFAAPSVALVRRSLQSWLDERAVAPDSTEDARVVVSELVANAVRHARPLDDGSLTVRWRLAGGALEVAVTDGGSPTAPHTVAAPVSAISGRGMTIVQALSERWWIEDLAGGTTVHARLRLRR